MLIPDKIILIKSNNFGTEKFLKGDQPFLKLKHKCVTSFCICFFLNQTQLMFISLKSIGIIDIMDYALVPIIFRKCLLFSGMVVGHDRDILLSEANKNIFLEKYTSSAQNTDFYSVAQMQNMII